MNCHRRAAAAADACLGRTRGMCAVVQHDDRNNPAVKYTMTSWQNILLVPTVRQRRDVREVAYFVNGNLSSQS